MRARRAAVIVPAMLGWLGLASGAHAASTYSLFSYDLAVRTDATVANTAAANGSVPLRLSGDWSPAVPDTDGVHFTGDQTSLQSVASAKPSSGYTLNIPETGAVGVAVRFTYVAPSSGTCFSDSPNVTQIGRFGKNVSQVKVQLSNCGINKTAVYPQCRVAGSKTPTSVWPRTSTLALVDGTTYVVYCFEGVTSAGNRSLFLRTTPIGSTMTANQWAYATPGVIRTSAALSVANKMPLPSLSNNTDQFIGDVARVAYCAGPNPGAVNSCLTTEVPTS